MLAQSKKTEEKQCLKEVSSVPLHQSIRHLDVAYRNFFKSRTGKHKGKKFGLPKFNKKINNQSICRVYQNRFFAIGQLRLPRQNR
jgi:putative transposase